MTVDPAEALSTRYEGRDYSFCAPGCLQRFEADPAAFLDSRPPAPAPSGGVWVCPMDPDVREEKPGACRKCGMALEPAVPAPPAARTQWTCPMHPQIVRDAPGTCPIC